MKFVALLSGGKDSCFNIIHCIQNGHELAAAASLGPQQGIEELDSFMYQTVGQDAIEFVARALEVPLYRRIISGTAINQHSEYGNRTGLQGVTGDETEDLYELLLQVKSSHPDVEAVSVGAILSNYQRVRVEHVCQRLALTPLCYLWQMDQDKLLDNMINTGLHAILIKVAGIGLTPKHLGKSLTEMQPTLRILNEKYGAHICGEGGEYETLTLDCPVFKQTIILDEIESVVHSDSSFATVAFLRIKNASLRKKTIATLPTCQSVLFDELYENIYSEIRSSTADLKGQHDTASPSDSETVLPRVSHRLGNWLTVSNIQRTSTGQISLGDEIAECFSILQEELSSFGLKLSNSMNIMLLLRDISTFAEVNAVYSKHFGTSPPARATVGVDLPNGIGVRMECIAYDESETVKRHALHVQSLSYWAPANIGPYSQAVSADERIFMSGQIGLIPAALSLPYPQDLAKEISLSFQHVRRVTESLKSNTGGGWEGHVQANFIWLTRQAHINVIHRAHCLEAKDSLKAPTLFIGVRELPKGAMVEKQVAIHTGRRTTIDEDGESVSEDQTPLFHQEIIGDSLYLESSKFAKDGHSSHTILWFDEVQCLSEVTSTYIDSNATILLRLFYIPPLSTKIVTSLAGLPVTAIGARFLSNGSRLWNYALYIQGK